MDGIVFLSENKMEPTSIEEVSDDVQEEIVKDFTNFEYIKEFSWD